MARFNRTLGSRGPSPIFKKRFIGFSQSAGNQVNQNIVEMTFRETGTIYAVKLSFSMVSAGPTGADTQKMDFGLRVGSEVAITSAVPDFSIPTQIETMNGFVVGSLMAQTEDINSPLKGWIDEKFRFRRKIDENDRIQLFGKSLVVNGSAQTMVVAGIMEVIIRTR